ncbi:sodium-dependent transporter [Thorsellia anophelis]|uniref:Neurotransmitter:Na+ symporter, NSS family n=1 Tax=Thorsellia anophelis DSM 18579 TaxID=1123402 RepID=A0A1H9YZE9_9GAMM|nr:sodium-dependent transporter [Thorsellia anophelis]SES74484.1 neurotransmitter:Na+ symporter, NSS family [Thorsellia anophelis DSM 18579]
MRSQWGSKLGFILASAGSTIGLGAVWKFPYVTATQGGGAFLIIYLAICMTLGLVLMSTEIAIGRSTQSSPYGAFKKLGGKAWPIIGLLGILICFMIISFYSVIGGWTSAYFVSTISGSTHTAIGSQSAENFSGFITNAAEPIYYHLFFAVVTAGTILFGVQKGIEKIAKYLMPVLFILLIILIFRSLTLEGASAGLLEFLSIDFSEVTSNTFLEALGLSFFSLSLAMGIMVTYGSYVDSQASIVPSVVWIIALTLMTCILSGLMVLPAVSALGLSSSAGPGLTFITMPSVFATMPYGQFFGALFFAALFVAALTSAISLMEVIVSFLIDEFKLSRPKSVFITLTGFFLLGAVCSLSLGIWQDYQLFGLGVFDLLDKLTQNILMPIGEIGLAIFAAWVVWPKIEQEIIANSPRLRSFMLPFRIFLGIIVPVIIMMIFIYQIKDQLINWFN